MIDDVASRRPTGPAYRPAPFLPALLLPALLGTIVAGLLSGCHSSQPQRLELEGSVLQYGYYLSLYVDSDEPDVDILQAAIQSELVHLESHRQLLDEQLQHLTDLAAMQPFGTVAPGPRLHMLYRSLGHAWLADHLAEKLDEHAVGHYFLEVGGAVRVKGVQVDGQAWHLALEHPTSSSLLHPRESASWLVPLDRHALVTAGDFRDRWQGLHGYAETPAGWELANGRERTLEISVIHESALTAAAWAAWLKPLAPDEGQEMAEQGSIAAYFIVTGSTGYDIRTTAALDRLLERSSYRNVSSTIEGSSPK